MFKKNYEKLKYMLQRPEIQTAYCTNGSFPWTTT